MGLRGRLIINSLIENRRCVLYAFSEGYLLSDIEKTYRTLMRRYVSSYRALLFLTAVTQRLLNGKNKGKLAALWISSNREEKLGESGRRFWGLSLS